jgi:hypothetical protein
MPNSIYNFFNFLEKKAGKTLSPEQTFNLKLKHAKELINDKDIDALPLEKKMVYYPERIKGDDLIINGSYQTPRGTKALPEGLVVKGTLVVNHLEEVPVNIKAESVHWTVSSDLYPKSFNGATFKTFFVSKGPNKLPENIQVTKELDIAYSEVESLPEGLNTEEIDARSSKLKSLPLRLTCDKLDIRGTGITEIPEGVIVKKKLSVDDIPTKYPKHLEDVISIGGGISIGQKKKYDALPEISVKIGKKVKKGKGMQIPLANIKGEEFANFINTFTSWNTVDTYRQRINDTAEKAGKLFNAKFDTVYFFYTQKSSSFDDSYFLLGKDNKNRELLLAPEAIISVEGQASTKSFNWGWNPTERQLKDTMAKLFPKSNEGEKSVKAVNIRTLMTGPKAKKVLWGIGRKTRGGFGIQGQAEDLIPSLSGVSQDNMTRTAAGYGITWGDMMVFDNNDAINIIARSKEQTEDGNYVYFDKYGYGQGGGSTTFEGPDYTVL